MSKIIWCGNKKWDDEYPEKPLPNNSVRIEMKNDIFVRSMPYGIIPLLFCFSIIYIKWHWIGIKAIAPHFVPIGIIIGLLLTPVHELLHAICYSKDQTVYMGLSLEKFAAFIVCHEAISKRRFITMSLMPVVLGVVPLSVFLLSPSSPVLSAICVPAGIWGMLSPMMDYLNVHMVMKQVPSGANIQSQNNGFYWFR